MSLLLTLVILIGLFYGARAADSGMTHGISEKVVSPQGVMINYDAFDHPSAFENERLRFPGKLLMVCSAPSSD